MAIINENVTTVGAGTQLNNSLYRGSCADYGGDRSWCFNGDTGCFGNDFRYYGLFRCRPVLALSLA